MTPSSYVPPPLGGAELGYAEITSNLALAPGANTFADITGLTITPTVGARPILVGVFLAEVTTSAAASDVSVAILEDGSIVAVATTRIDSANTGAMFNLAARRTPAAGAHTYKAQMKTVAAGTVTVVAGAVFPGFITVTER